MTHMFIDATSSLPDYSVRAFSDETSSLPDYSVHALFWQIEIWSGIYTVYFNCKYFTSLYFIYALAIRMPPWWGQKSKEEALRNTQQVKRWNLELLQRRKHLSRTNRHFVKTKDNLPCPEIFRAVDFLGNAPALLRVYGRVNFRLIVNLYWNSFLIERFLVFL